MGMGVLHGPTLSKKTALMKSEISASCFQEVFYKVPCAGSCPPCQTERGPPLLVNF
jgi:hypothetical protein